MIGVSLVDGLPYPVAIAADASLALPELVAGRCSRAAIVSDVRVGGRAAAIADALAGAGCAIVSHQRVEGGERAKTWEQAGRLHEALARDGADRSTWVVAVGGGSITDLAGFVAATYMRGVPWAAVPTSILGMADAAIGGKTAVDHAGAKNVVGAFWDPGAVVADIAALATLPRAQRATGVAEIVKAAIIDDPALLDAVDELPLDAQPGRWREIVARAARVKAKIVAADPRETGRRAVLNFGHTVGHAIESASRYEVSHGAAVAVGMRAAGLIAQARGWWPRAAHARLLDALANAGLPLAAGGLDLQDILDRLSRDKKGVAGRVRFVLPADVGDVRHGIEVEAATVRAAVDACLLPPSPHERAR